MKKIYLPLLLLFFFQLIYGQSFVSIGTNFGTGNFAAPTNTYGPFTTNTTVSWNRHAFIYPASLLTDIPSNSNIDSLFFSRVSISNTYGMLAGLVTCNIYLKNTTITDFGASPLDWSIESASATLVYNNDPSSVVSNTAGFKKFIVSTPFLFTGNNLEVLIEYTQSAPATGEVVWGYDNNAGIPAYLANSTKYISGSSGSPTNLLTNSNLRHPALAIYYTPIQPIDAKVSAIIGPASISCYGSPQNFSVLLKNDGNTNISVGTAAVTLKISGANSFMSTLSNTGSIAPGDFESIDFAGVNLNNPGNNDDTAFVVLAGDPITQNDTAVSQTFTAETIATFPAVEDVEGSLPVFSYASQIAMNQAWFIQTGDYTNADQTNPLVPHSGSNFFLFDAYNNLSGTISLLYSNCLTLTTGSLNSVEFYMSHDDLVFSTYLDSMYVSVSTDKGVTWTRLQGFQRYDAAFTTPDWKKESVDLSAYAGLTIQIGFEGVSDFGNSFGLDDITVISASVTPVTLINFNATRNGSENSITWSTSQELNSRYFAVERSTDGINFSKIGQVAAAGNSNTQRTYQFVDPSPAKGINYYRLMIVDIDNAIKYSVVKNVKNFGLVRFVVYPNPVKEKLLLDIDVEKTGKGELNITDINGRNIYKSDVTLLKGVNTIPVDVARFSKGTYFIKIQTTDESFMKKFSKQ
ncbi:MAG: T9SS type A sorting domain-containing protein [Ginsengibacter sp.]